MNRLTAILAGGIGVLALAGSAFAATGGDVTQAQIEAAKTSEQHEAIARSYEEEATAAERRAEGHARMAQTYRHAYAKMPRASMASHCEKLEKDYRNAASEYHKLAEEHHKMAAEAR